MEKIEWFNKLLKGDKVIAINPKSKKLTHGKVYFVEWLSLGNYIAVKNDDRRTKPYHYDNFTIAFRNII